MKIITDEQLEKYGYRGYSGGNYKDFSIDNCRISISYGTATTETPLEGGNRIFWTTLYIAESLRHEFYIINCKKDELDKVSNKKLLNILLKKIPLTSRFIKGLYDTARIAGRNEIKTEMKNILKEE